MQESIEILRTELEERLRFQTFLAETSARFVNLPANQIDGEIEGTQRRMCEFLDLDRSALWQVPDLDPGTLTLTHVYQPQGGPPIPKRRGLRPSKRQEVLPAEERSPDLRCGYGSPKGERRRQSRE